MDFVDHVDESPILCVHLLLGPLLQSWPDVSVIHENITKTYLYNFDPLKPHFYIVKLGFTGYTLFFLFLLKT